MLGCFAVGWYTRSHIFPRPPSPTCLFLICYEMTKKLNHRMWLVLTVVYAQVEVLIWVTYKYSLKYLISIHKIYSMLTPPEISLFKEQLHPESFLVTSKLLHLGKDFIYIQHPEAKVFFLYITSNLNICLPTLLQIIHVVSF